MSKIFEQPLKFVNQVKEGKHIVLFYEELEYARLILFQFIKNGLIYGKHCSYVSEENIEAVQREMADSRIDINKFTKNDLLHIYQIPSLTDYPGGTQIGTERLENIILDPWTKIGQPDRLVLRCLYKINTKEQIKSNLKWEHDYRFRDFKSLRGTMICSYPVNDIIPTISEPVGSYGKWMNDLLEIYDGVIFARKFWKGVAFNLD